MDTKNLKEIAEEILSFVKEYKVEDKNWIHQEKIAKAYLEQVEKIDRLEMILRDLSKLLNQYLIAGIDDGYLKGALKEYGYKNGKKPTN